MQYELSISFLFGGAASFCQAFGLGVTTTPTPSCGPKKGALRAKARENRLRLSKLKVNFRLHSACTIFQPQPKALPLSRGRDATGCLRRFFLAMAKSKQVSLCSFGLTKKFASARSVTKVSATHQRVAGKFLTQQSCDYFCSLRSPQCE